MTTRRKETRTVTVNVEKRIEWTAADLRRRLRVPDDAILMASDETGLAVSAGKLVATFTRSTTKGG